MSDKYPKDFIDRVICGDCLEVMRKIPDESVDLVVTSPPYNLKNSTGNGMKAVTKTGSWAGNPLQNGYAHYDDNMPYEQYVVWQKNCLREAMRLLKDNGAIFYNHKMACSERFNTRQTLLTIFPFVKLLSGQICIEISPEYCRYAQKRIDEVSNPMIKETPKNILFDLSKF